MKRRLTKAEINHLRRLVGWVDCDIGQPPEDMIEMVRSMAPKIGEVSEEGRARLVEAHRRAEAVPKYVRAAVKALRKVVDESVRDIETVEGGRVLQKLPSPANKLLGNEAKE